MFQSLRSFALFVIQLKITWTALQTLEKGFAIGAVVAAFALGGSLYVLYPYGFAAYSTNTSETAQQSYTTETDQTLMAENNSTTSEVPTDTSGPSIPTLPQPSDGVGGY